jgi:hypothetical protein
MTTFLFLRITRDLRSFVHEAVIRGEPRNVLPFLSNPACRFLLLAQACPASMLNRTAPPRGTCVPDVESDVHGSLDRAKDVSSSVESAL